MKDTFKQLSKKFHEDIVGIRRHIHANPELSFVEFKTSEFVCSLLEEMDIPYEKGMVKTGIVGTIEGKNPTKRTVALRAELDALPIFEKNDISYKSTNEGVMHACGHDVHMASMLGAAKILNSTKEDWEGTVKLVFQPGEEKLPGGAIQMIDAGLLEDINASSMLALHVLPSMEVGRVGFRPGPYMASADEIYLKVKGQGGHAALPALNIDPIPMAAEILVALNEIKPDFDTPMVLAFGKIVAAGATNVIPNEVEIEGTFRAMNEEWRDEVHRRVESTAKEIAEKHGGSCEVLIKKGYPCLVNDEQVAKDAKENAQDYLGTDKVDDLDLRMTADDFASFSQRMPACFLRLGVGNKEKGISSGVHTDTFNIDERALEVSAGLMAWLTYNELNKG
jgi:amidohydrolase